MCPARDTVCRKCQKKGHYQSVCKSGASIRELHQEDEETFLGAVGENPWMVDLKVNSQSVEFCIVTGAEVTIIPERVYQKLHNAHLLS
jgi:hypothetical protein